MSPPVRGWRSGADASSEYQTNGAAVDGQQSRPVLVSVRRPAVRHCCRSAREGRLDLPKGFTMPDILHRISIDAPSQRVHDLIASTSGIARWWTGRPLTGEHAVGSRFSVYFGDAEQPAAVMQVLTDTRDQVVWLVTDGPDSWIDT